ncbi:MAG: lytic transglycosylase domain-containing protein [Gemmatimonadetes bacterium]|nr:lytic transglycosylase domain-containing protein [Gemmatimonadota bacterium]
MDRSSRRVRLCVYGCLVPGVALGAGLEFRSRLGVLGVGPGVERFESAVSSPAAVAAAVAGDPAGVSVAEVPLEVNARVEKWLHRYVGGQRRYFQAWLAREGRYGELIRAKLRDRGLPEDLVYLAMIESGFLPGAYSVAEASGLWQMMDGTARRYGLRVDVYVDERRDPVRATDAALAYLEDLYRQFGSWYLAAAAYNAGEARVARALRGGRAGTASQDRDVFWEIMEGLPPETREYVPMMIAAMILAKNPERYGFEFEPFEPFRYERVFVPGGTTLSRVAWLAGVSLDTLRALNPHFVLGVTPPEISYPVRVPAGTAARVVARYGRVNAQLLALAAEALAAEQTAPGEADPGVEG